MKNLFTIWNQLTKPRVTSLVLATVFPGLYLGGNPTAGLIFWTLLATYLMGSASFIFNQVVEHERDGKMERTKERPIPSGQVSVRGGLALGFLSIALSFWIYVEFVNLLAFACALGSLLLYVFLYTIWLKPRTEQNIVIGGISGCVGTLVGYASVSGTLPSPAWVLVAVIFLWTPAHFWALAIFLKDDYEFAGIPMMPVVSGVEKTVKQIFAYSVLYSLAAFCFYFFDSRMGAIFLSGMGFLTLAILGFAWKLLQNPSPLLAKKFFFFSILHLFLVNVLIVLESKI